MKLSRLQRTVHSFCRETVYGFITLAAIALPRWRNAKSTHVLPALPSVKVRQPVNFENLSIAFRRNLIDEKYLPIRRLFTLSGVWVSGEACIFRDLRVFEPSLCWAKDLPCYRNGKFLSRQWRTKALRFENTPVALIYDNWSATNYYHWMIESLPRLVFVTTCYPDCTLLLPHPAPSFIEESLRYFNVHNIHRLDRNTGLIFAKELLFPELIYYYNPEEVPEIEPVRPAEATLAEKARVTLRTELISLVRGRLVPASAHAAAWRKVYTTRSAASTRRLVNENQLLSILKSAGVDIINFETVNFEEQVRLMSETKLLIGVHGSNLVNMVFLPGRATVVELMNEEHFNEAYYLLASSFGFEYYSVPCSAADKETFAAADSVGRNDADLLVNVQAVEQVLNQFMTKEKEVSAY